MPAPASRRLQLVEHLADGSWRRTPVDGVRLHAAEPGVRYALIDLATGAAPKGLVLKQKGSALVVDLAEPPVQVEITGFYQAPDAAFLPEARDGADTPGASVVTAATPVEPSVGGTALVWTAAADTDTPAGGFTPLPLPLPWALGGLGAGVAAVAFGGGGGSTAPDAAHTLVTGTVVGGPVMVGNGLTVTVFQADGVTRLGEAKVAPDGSFTVDIGSYTGVVIAKVADADSGPDYLDETTGTGKDLSATLFSSSVVLAPNATVVMNINALTTLAHHAATAAAGSAPLTAAGVDDANHAVAQLFGLESLQGTPVTPTNGGNYDPADGLGQGEVYGAVLAALSGADAGHGGDSQQTIDSLLAGLTLAGGQATLDAAAQTLVVAGAERAAVDTGPALQGGLSAIIDTFAPVIGSGSEAAAIDEGTGAQRLVYTASASDASALRWSLKATGDHALFSIDATTGAVTLTGNPDHEAEASYSFTVVATDAAGNRSEQAVTLAVNDLDEVAPTLTSGATASTINENSGAGQVVYTATSTDSGDISGGVSYSLKDSGDHTLFTINAATGAVTLTGNPDQEAKASYAFIVIATDAAGNRSEQAVPLAIGDLDESAPTLTSGATASTINENSGAGQVVYTATSTDSGDISGGVSYSLKDSGDHALFTINAATGAVTLTGNPDQEAKPSYAFTVVATDAAGNRSEQAVTLAIGDLDESAPTLTSGATASTINENSGAGQVVYTATSTDAGDISGGVSYSLKDSGDHALFTISAATGAVTLTGNPDQETKPSYAFTVVATDAAGNRSEQAVTLAIGDLDESAPTLTSGATATTINENSGAGQVVYTATSTDAGDIATGTTSYSLKTTGDHALITVNAATGAVTLTGNPDQETKPSYAFTIVATDAAGNSSEQAVTLTIGDLDESAPTLTSGATATAINENSGVGQVIYTATSTDSGDIATGSTSYSLKTTGDHALFTVNAATGAVTLTGNPDQETKPSYAFTIVATDAAGNSSEQAVTLTIGDLDESAPTLTSGATATAINENSGVGQVIYTATSTDAGDIATGSTSYSLKTTGDHALFTINAATGAVTLTGNPDQETKPSYAFTVVATDAAGNSSEQAVTLTIGDLDESAPTLTSGATATAINENSGVGQVIYTATSTDSGDIATGSTSYSLKTTGDHALFTINAATGAVTLTGNPDQETKPSYAFTVVATDAAGNSSEQAVTLAVNDLDDLAPSITSGSTATAVTENSGAGQVVYTATSTDSGDVVTGSTAYSLKTTGDHAAFTINASTGAVTLAGNPDYETKASYAFTVVATDAAGNSSEQAVTLAINDIADETAPSVASIAISSATGAQNSSLNAGDVVHVTVTMDEATLVNTSGGTPRVALTVGGATVHAGFVSGSGSTALVFDYTVQAGDTDGNGIAMGANALQLNGGTLRDAAGNAASIGHSAVADNASYLVDTTAPSFSSGSTASAINENSGSAQVVYTAAASDSATVAYSLKATGDHASFSINGSSGAVTLTGNPDYETKPSYAFTVVATDAAGNASERAVSLAINDLDEVAPAVSGVAFSGATGAVNSRLNAGDVVNVTVTMGEATIVDTAGGTPRLALTVGASTVYADFVSGSGSTSLVFSHTVQAGETDANGIAIGTNALQLNGGTLRDAAGNNAVITHASVADNASYLVDTTAPTLSSSTPADNAGSIAVGNNLVLNFSETVQAGSGNIVISDGASDTRTIAIVDSSQVTISGSTVTVNPTADLHAGTGYNVQLASGVLADQAGNAYGGISNSTTLNFTTASSVNTSVVVFDLIEGTSSDHSGRAFQSGVAYTIYVRVNSNSSALSTDGSGPGASDTWGMWTGAGNLGADDRIVLVGSGSAVKDRSNHGVQSHYAGINYIYWYASTTFAATQMQNGTFYRGAPDGNHFVDLWAGGWANNPNAGSALANVYKTVMPAGILTSQGLK